MGRARERGETTVAVAAAVMVLALAAAVVLGGRHRAPAPVVAAAPLPPPAAVTLPILPARVRSDPAPGATGVAPGGRVSVAVADGRLDAPRLTAGDGHVVAGALSPDGTRWTSGEDLAFGQAYSWAGSAVGDDGAVVPLTGGFGTAEPANLLHARFETGDGATVGVAQPVILSFDGVVTDRAAVERALTVRTSVPTEGSWAWLPDTGDGSRVHWRPKNYWTPGTRVEVTADLFGVPAGGGTYLDADVSSRMSIGPAQITRADVNSHRVVVVRDGRTVIDLPASYGLGEDPRRNTRNGVHVVMSKEPEKTMSNPTFGYTDVHVVWATRISNNGEYVHANPETLNAQGQENVTHGCINLSVPNAKSYYDQAQIGDPVEVTGSPIGLSAEDGDVYDWAIGWDQWSGMSALRAAS